MLQGFLLISVLLGQVIGEDSQRAIELAKDALSVKSGVDRDQIVVVRADAVEWPDVNLGCPAEPSDTEPMPTPGHRVLLSIGKSLYRVHVGGGSALVCGGALKARGTPEVGEVIERKTMKALDPNLLKGDLQELVEQAKSDLADRLSLEAGQIDVVEVSELMWPDSSLGCPEPGMMYAQVLQEGCLIRLRVGKATYDYHSSKKGPPFPCDRAKQRLPKKFLTNTK